ncbi:MAG: M1 family metallopeptidase, partial [Ignavibacteriaceae bacterium]
MKLTFQFILLLCVITFQISFSKDGIRLSNGKPASTYWQQQVDYNVEAELIPQKKLLNGKGIITYSNNSPDTLKSLVWHLYQNVFRKDSSPRKNNTQNSRAYGITKGIEIEKILIDGKTVLPQIDETLMETVLPQPLLPNSKIEITVEWNYDIPRNASLRTGSNGNDFGICQWYPQIAVYDDLDGWDRTQYLGIAEFYLDYGNWNVKLTLPANYVVASTGVLQNANEILSVEQLKRFNSLSKDSVTKIILPVESGDTTIAVREKKRTWHFTAENIRDFAWAASPDFVWDGTKTKDDVNIYAFYKAKDYRVSIPMIMSDASNWDEGAKMAKHAIEFYSSRYGKYSYPQATVVTGPVGEMEYPMMIFAADGDPISNELEIVIAHELGHEWYPMMIGSNETNYPFMDEGFTTYITSNCIEDWSGSNGLFHKNFVKKYSWLNLPTNNERQFEQRLYLMEARANIGASILSHPYSIPPAEYGVMAYMKPGSVLVMLEDVLGEKTFNAAMTEYYNRWKYKHPYPQDFFSTIEDVAGYDLDWFWHQWFEEKWKVDIAVDGVENEEVNGKWKSTITLVNKEQAKMPATLQLSLTDGTTRDVRFPVTIWNVSNRADFVVDSLPAKVNNVIVDPKIMLADVNRLNNSWCIPRVEFDYGMNFMNFILYPLDAYRINFAPSFGFNLRDGIELGTSINGSYMASDYNTTFTTRYGTLSNIPDFEFNYSTPVRMFSPNLTTSIGAFRLDGRSGGSWNIQAVFDKYTNLTNYFKHSLIVSTSVYAVAVKDRRYLDNQKEWQSGNLIFGKSALIYKKNFANGSYSIILTDEYSIPGSDFQYGKITGEMKTVNLLFAGLTLRTRTFSGMSSGNVPAQTAYSLTQSSPLERFDSWFFRTPIMGQKFHNHWIKPGGGNIFLAQDSTAEN